MEKIKGPLDREDDFNGGPVTQCASPHDAITQIKEGDTTIRIMDQVRDLYARVQRLCIDRDSTVRGERAADQEVERLLAQLQLAHATVRALNVGAPLNQESLDLIGRIIDDG